MATELSGEEFPFAPTALPGGAALVEIAMSTPTTVGAIGIGIWSLGDVNLEAGLDRAALERSGFDGKIGATLVLPDAQGPAKVLFGLGDPASADIGTFRNAGAAFALAARRHADLAIAALPGCAMAVQACAEGITEGVLLARYRYDVLRRKDRDIGLTRLTLVAAADTRQGVEQGAERGRIQALAQNLARDLANTPHSHLNATKLGTFAMALGARHGFGVELFDKAALQALGCGGLLGVNAGSIEPPCMVKLTLRPASPKGHLALVGKGVMYDSGGISLKPSDRVHAQMKNDMTGAAVILASVAALAERGCSTAITAFLMCTDNMPSGSATGLGDVLTMRDGTTVEVIDTDAEGRLMLADGLALAAEAGVDAIVDVATLTGSVLRALGPDMAGVLGTDQALVEKVKAAGAATGELVWQLPLHRPYRRMIESAVADIANCAPAGRPDGIIAALFMSEFVGEVPWAHIDIRGTAQTEENSGWQRTGCSGFGARLLIELAEQFDGPSGSR